MALAHKQHLVCKHTAGQAQKYKPYTSWHKRASKTARPVDPLKKRSGQKKGGSQALAISKQAVCGAKGWETGVWGKCQAEQCRWGLKPWTAGVGGVRA